MGHTDFVGLIAKARAYYRNETDIMFPPLKEEREKKEKPLQNADNRIPFNFHGLLVNRKASYMYVYGATAFWSWREESEQGSGEVSWK